MKGVRDLFEVGGKFRKLAGVGSNGSNVGFVWGPDNGEFG